MDFNLIIQNNIWWLIVIYSWATAWKAWALWIAAKKDQKVWFLVFIIVSTAGILEIFYIFYFSKQDKSTIKANKKLALPPLCLINRRDKYAGWPTFAGRALYRHLYLTPFIIWSACSHMIKRVRYHILKAFLCIAMVLYKEAFFGAGFLNPTYANPHLLAGG